MSEATTDHPIPRRAILGAGVLVAVTIAAAGIGRWAHVGVQARPPLVAAETVDLVFTDRADGTVDVTTATGTVVLEPGTNGFIRGILRGMTRQRQVLAVGPDRPYRLIRRVDGRLVLEDPATGRSIDLGAYGSGNAEVFARFLHA